LADIFGMSDVAAISSFAASQTANQVNIAVAKKTLDAAEAQGEAAIKLLEGVVEMQEQHQPSLEPHLGKNLDVTG